MATANERSFMKMMLISSSSLFYSAISGCTTTVVKVEVSAET
ncbi:MAG TPA: hypothetical protein VED16_01420 [Candidatus Acidoferrum sp.]|nr:hypothetical protein [Candidatus Acidoferrum sp.]